MRLHVLGSINLDVIVEVEALPTKGQTLLALNSGSGPGGKGANQAVAAARYGARVRLCGAVGSDEAGRGLLNGLKNEGIDVSDVASDPDHATGRAYVIVSRSGENMILVDAGANKTAAFTAQGAAGPSIFLTQLETPIASAAAMFSTARDGDLRVLNAAPAVAEARSLFPFAEVIIVNEGELAFYAEAPRADLETQARRLLTRSDQTVIVTVGEAGALIVTPDGRESVPGRQVRAVDTTGAGDCFTGVLAAALAEGKSLKEAAAAANLAASLSVQRLGATASPSRSELESAARG